MNMITQLENALKEAMRAHDEVRKRTIRMAISAIRFAEIEKGQKLDENGVLAILQKEIKARHESIADAERAGRADLVTTSKEEIAILEEYLPKQFTEAEIDQLAKQVIAEVGATSIREMGQVMKVLVPRLQGRATGDQANQAVRKLLS